MSQRPIIKQPQPLASAPIDVGRLPETPAGAAAAVDHMLGDLRSEVSAEAAPLWQFVLDHAHTIATAVVSLVVLIVGVGIWQWYVENGEEKASMELGRISAMQNPQTRLAALEAFIGEAPQSLQSAVQLELAAAAVQAEDLNKAVAAYATVATQEGSSPLGVVARLNEVDVLLRQGKAAEALSRLEALLPTAQKELQGVLQSQLGEVAELAGQKDKAIAAYKVAIEDLTKTSPDEAAYYQARIAALQ